MNQSNLTETGADESVDRLIYQAETDFLQSRIDCLQADIEKKLENLIRDSDLEDLEECQVPNGDRQLFRLYHQEIDVLNELVQDPQRETRGLESTLGDRLRLINRRVVRSALSAANTGSYSQDYWEIDRLRDILVKVLDDWWQWLRDKNAD